MQRQMQNEQKAIEDNMKNKLSLRLLNIFVFALALYVNYLSVVTNLGGKTIRELSDKYDNLFTPSPQTFSIWGVIYTLVMIFLVVQFINKYDQVSIMKNLLFSISCLLNAAWIILWQFEFIVGSVLVMLGLLTTLTLINKELIKGPTLLKLVFGIYLGWICIATVANLTALLVAKGIVPSIEAQEMITVSILVVAAVLTGWLVYKLANPFLVVSVGWAFYGVYNKRIVDHSLIAYSALAAMAAVIVFVIFYWSSIKKEEKV